MSRSMKKLRGGSRKQMKKKLAYRKMLKDKRNLVKEPPKTSMLIPRTFKKGTALEPKDTWGRVRADNYWSIAPKGELIR
jgi:hypothetical protein